MVVEELGGVFEILCGVFELVLESLGPLNGLERDVLEVSELTAVATEGLGDLFSRVKPIAESVAMFPEEGFVFGQLLTAALENSLVFADIIEKVLQVSGLLLAFPGNGGAA